MQIVSFLMNHSVFLLPDRTCSDVGSFNTSAGTSFNLSLRFRVNIVPSVVENRASNQRELHDEAEEEGRTLVEDIGHKVVVVVFVSAHLQVVVFDIWHVVMTHCFPFGNDMIFQFKKLLDVLLRVVKNRRDVVMKCFIGVEKLLSLII